MQVTDSVHYPTNKNFTPTYGELLVDFTDWYPRQLPLAKVIKVTHTCPYCPRLGCFTEIKDRIADLDMSVGVIYPIRARVSDDMMPLITHPLLVHLFNLCCCAFGVGNWVKFRQINLLSDIPDATFEFTAHVKLGLADLSDYWGVKLWPPFVAERTAAYMAIVQSLYPDMRWPFSNDILAGFYLDPLQTSEMIP